MSELRTQRTWEGHEVTEVLELDPAELIGRRDKGRKLACKSCDGELCRAPLVLRPAYGRLPICVTAAEVCGQPAVTCSWDVLSAIRRLGCRR